MKRASEEWVAKAEGDWRTAQRELSAIEAPNFDAVCFHAQQCCEKYLKALLSESGSSFPKTHNLLFLLDLMLSTGADLEVLRDALRRLDAGSVQFRYPGAAASPEVARDALEDCRGCRAALRGRLGLSAT